MIWLALTAFAALVLVAALTSRRQQTQPISSARPTTRSIVGGALIVEATLLVVVALQATGDDGVGDSCSCGSSNVWAWVAPGGALLVPIAALGAVAATRRAQRRTSRARVE